MTPEETRQAAQVMLAHAEGKRIESLDEETDDYFVTDSPIWDWADNLRSYRVAPERWSGKIWVHPDGQAHQQTFFTMSADEAIRQGWRLIEAQEVEP